MKEELGTLLLGLAARHLSNPEITEQEFLTKFEELSRDILERHRYRDKHYGEPYYDQLEPVNIHNVLIDAPFPALECASNTKSKLNAIAVFQALSKFRTPNKAI